MKTVFFGTSTKYRAYVVNFIQNYRVNKFMFDDILQIFKVNTE